jgi:hypothetical protein
MRTRHPSHLGVVTSLVWQLTRATCWGHPHHPCPAALKCRRRTGRGRRGATRPWARAHARWLPPSKRTNGSPVLVRLPVGRVLPSRGDLRLVKPTLREGRRKGRRPPVKFMTDQSAPTPTPCRGAGRGGDRQTWRRRRPCSQWQNLVLPRGACSRYSSGAVEPQKFTCPLSPAGAKVRPRPS